MGLGSAATESSCYHLVLVLVLLEILFARTIQTGQGGICGCLARLFRG